ncbi:STAS domain-containing protein [Thalassotalea sp. PLHSN55]|uniref:STAS domain-containing protein n=1 Tax=Thalassotalea sp. PLHSN55 TaxID=3435888 RepID=UPI003F83E11D
MTVKTTISADKKNVSIAIENHFDFSLHQKFRDAYIDHELPNTHFSLDLHKATYMDSSALGMILLLKDHAEKEGGSITITKPNEDVNKILEMAQFHRLMKIEL